MRGARIQEITDVGVAVKAVQDLFFDRGGIAMQRLESHRVNGVTDELRMVRGFLRPLRNCRQLSQDVGEDRGRGSGGEKRGPRA